MSFVDKVRKAIRGFLASQDAKFLTTENGLKLELFDNSFTDKVKS